MQSVRSRHCQRSRFDSSRHLHHRSCFRAAQTTSHHRASTVFCRAAAVQSQSGLQQLLDWASGNKVSTDKLSVANDVATDASVLVAAKDISQGEQILAVPDSAWVRPESAQQSNIGKLVSGLEPWLQLALLLLAERAKPGGSSPLQAFIAAAADSSSSHLNSPLFWSDAELQMLAGTQLLESLLGYKQFFQEQYQQLDQDLFSPNRATFPRDHFSYDRFVWAVATVRSKLHPPLEADPVALVPLADAVPHNRGGNVSWRLKSSGVFGRSQVLSVEATRAIRRGESLSMDYGPDKLDNSLVLDYGVIDADNLKGGYSLTLTLPESDRYYADKLDILERAGLSGSTPFNLVRGQEPPQDMMAFLRIMQLSGSDCFLLEPIFEAEVWDFMCFPISPSNEAAVCAAMVEGAREALSGYGSGIDEDLGLLRGRTLASGSREEMAVQVRLGEKEALDSLMAFFEGRAADLNALEYYQERRLKRLGLMDEDGRSTYDSFFKDGIA